MSNLIGNAIAQIAFESGELGNVPEDLHQEVVDLVVSEAEFVGEPTITSVVDEGAKAESVTDQLNELADRADDAAKIEDPAVADVAVESLHREFQTIMRANSLPFAASSFESSYVRDKQAKGLAADARRVAGYSTEVRKDAIGYSTEAAPIINLIRRDKQRLDEASSVLVKATAATARVSSKLAERPVFIEHTGSAIWLTVNNAAVLNLRQAVEAEAATLHKLHDAINSTIQAVGAAATAWKENPQASMADLLPESKVSSLNTFGASHFLMGNFTISANAGKTSPVMVLRRTSLHKMQTGNVVRSVGWTLLAKLGWSIAAGIALAIGGAVTGALLPGVALGAGASALLATGKGYATTAAAVYSGMKNYEQNVNKSDVKSAASATDLVHALSTISKFSQFTNFTFNEGAIVDAMDAAHKAGGSSKTYGAFEDTLAHIATAIDVLYEQAIYDTVEGAKLAAQVTKHF